MSLLRREYRILVRQLHTAHAAGGEVLEPVRQCRQVRGDVARYADAFGVYSPMKPFLAILLAFAAAPAWALEPVITCNCSICSRKGTLLTFVPADAFNTGEDLKVLASGESTSMHWGIRLQG